METSENNVLWLTKGEKQYALLFAEDRYHLLTINEQCTRKLVLKLLRTYPCVETGLREKQIRFGTILKKDIFGIRFDGYRAGNEFLLRIINQKTRKYTLTEAFDPDTIERFFADVRRLPAPWDNAPDAWRKERQDPDVLAQMKAIKLCLIVAAILFGALSFFGAKPNVLWSGLFLLVPLICIFLAIITPTYFTLADKDDNRTPEYGIGLSLLTILPLMFLSLRSFFTNYVEFGAFFLYSAICGALICLILWILVKEFRNRVGHFLLLSLIIVTMCGAGVVGYLNTALNTAEPQIRTYTVEKLTKSSGKSTSYNCYVTLHDGKQIKIRVSKELYETLEVGERVRVAHKEGGLGLEYVFILEE